MLSVPQIDLALKVLIERQMGKWVVVIYLMKCKFSISIGWLNLFLSSENWYRVFCKCFNVELVQIDLAMLLAFVSVFNTGRYVVKSLVRNWMEIIFVQKTIKTLTIFIFLTVWSQSLSSVIYDSILYQLPSTTAPESNQVAILLSFHLSASSH